MQNLFYPMISQTFFGVSWSICVEELFYIIFPLLLLCITVFHRKANQKLINPNLLIVITCMIIIIIIFFIRSYLNYNDWGAEVRRVAIFRIDAIAFGGLGYFVTSYLNKYKYLDIFNFIGSSINFYNIKSFKTICN